VSSALRRIPPMHMFPLERRILRAVDLTIATLDVKAQLAWSQSTHAYDVSIVLKNSGASAFTGKDNGGPYIDIDVLLTKDKIIGNADDIREEAAVFNDVSIPAGGADDLGSWVVSIDHPGASGAYYVAAIADSAAAVAES